MEAAPTITLPLASNTEFIPLHLAIDQGNLDLCKDLLAAGYKPTTDPSGWTLLHRAAHKGNLRLVKYLVELQNQPIFCIDHKGRQPIDLAIAGNHIPVVNYLRGYVDNLFQEQQQTLQNRLQTAGAEQLRRYPSLAGVLDNSALKDQLSRQWLEATQAFFQGQLPPPVSTGEEQDPTIQAQVDELMAGMREGLRLYVANNPLDPKIKEAIEKISLEPVKPYATEFVRKCNQDHKPPLEEPVQEIIEQPYTPAPVKKEPEPFKPSKPKKPMETKPDWSVEHTFIGKIRKRSVQNIEEDLKKVARELSSSQPKMQLVQRRARSIYNSILQERKEIKPLYRALKHITRHRRSDQLIINQALDQIGWPGAIPFAQRNWETNLPWMDIPVSTMGETIQIVEESQQQLSQTNLPQLTKKLRKKQEAIWGKKMGQLVKNIEMLSPLLEDKQEPAALEKMQQQLQKTLANPAGSDRESKKHASKTLANLHENLTILQEQRVRDQKNLQEKEETAIYAFWESEEAILRQGFEDAKLAKQLLKRLEELQKELEMLLEKHGLNRDDYVDKPGYESDYENNYTAQELMAYLDSCGIDPVAPEAPLLRSSYQLLVALNLVANLRIKHLDHFRDLMVRVGQPGPLTEQDCFKLLWAIPGLKETFLAHYPRLKQEKPSTHVYLAKVVLRVILQHIPQPVGQTIQLRTMNEVKKNIHRLEQAIKTMLRQIR